MFTLAMMLVVLHLVIAFYLATMQTVARLRHVTNCVTTGKMDEIMGLIETKDELGQITHSFSVLIQRLQAEWAYVQANEAWLSTTLRSIGHAVIVTDAQGRIMLMNDVAQLLTGWNEEDARGKALPEVFQIVLDGTHQPVESPVTKVVREGTVVGLANHTVLISKNGAECPIDDSAAPIRDRTGKISGVVLVFRDVAERKRGEDEQRHLRAQLLQNDRMAGVGQLAAGVAHEINNPIGFVKGNLNTLQEYIGDLLSLLKSYERLEAATRATLEGQSAQPEVVLVEIANIKQKIRYDALAADLEPLLTESTEGIERVREIIKNLKEFSRVDEGTHKHADINHCVKSTLHMVWNELKYKAEIIEDYGDIPEIFCSPGELNQVFMNLLVNAGQAIADKGCIGIRTFVKDKTIFVEISDTGCGILPQNLARIFEPFYTTKDVGKGTGLGLSISYGIVQKHKGRLEVESTVDQGTTFRVCLPIEESTVTYPACPAVQQDSMTAAWSANRADL
jgi:PAS domain S-box-containing protein